MATNEKAAGCGDTQAASNNRNVLRHNNSKLSDIEIDETNIEDCSIVSSTPELIVIGGKNTIYIDSRSIAKEFGRRHDNVLQTIKRLISEGHIPFLEFKECFYSKNGRSFPCYELTEKAFLIAMPFIGGRKSKEGQVRLVNHFFKLREQLDRQMTEKAKLSYQIARCSGKNARSIMTDAIQSFVTYAKSNGSQNGDRYFSIITRAVYQSLLIIEPKAVNVRELLTAIQLSTLQTAELIAAKVLTEGMEDNQHYKNIYQQVKEELEIFATSRTKVLG